MSILLKQQFEQTPILAMPDQMQPFHVSIDALLVAIRVVLEQENKQGELHPCAFYS